VSRLVVSRCFFISLFLCRRTEAVAPGQWVLMPADSLGYGDRRNPTVYGRFWKEALLLCVILRVDSGSAWVCVPDADVDADGCPLMSVITLGAVRDIRVSSVAARRVAAPLATRHRVPAPSSLGDVPVLDREALAKSNVLHAISSVLRSNSKQEKPTDSRITHLDRAEWVQLCSEGFRGKVSNIRTFYPLVESFDADYRHRFGYAAVQFSQTIVYQRADELARLGCWLGQRNFNMFRRGCRPSILRQKQVYYDQINVVHPSLSRTKIRLQYNVSTNVLRVTTSYHRAGPFVQHELPNYLPHGPGCTEVPEELEVTQESGQQIADAPSLDEYSDNVLSTEDVVIDNATYRATSVGEDCELTLVSGIGPQTRLVTRLLIAERIVHIIASYKSEACCRRSIDNFDEVVVRDACFTRLR
jgi:hypothetical protein